MGEVAFLWSCVSRRYGSLCYEGYARLTQTPLPIPVAPDSGCNTVRSRDRLSKFSTKQVQVIVLPARSFDIHRCASSSSLRSWHRLPQSHIQGSTDARTFVRINLTSWFPEPLTRDKLPATFQTCRDVLSGLRARSARSVISSYLDTPSPDNYFDQPELSHLDATSQRAGHILKGYERMPLQLHISPIRP